MSLAFMRFLGKERILQEHRTASGKGCALLKHQPMAPGAAAANQVFPVTPIGSKQEERELGVENV